MSSFTSTVPSGFFVRDDDDFDTDVVVVGLGPGGSTAALALASQGIRVHAVSMFPWVANSPRAHICNQRSVEVFRDLDIEDEVTLRATPWGSMGETLFTTSLAGEELARIQTWGTGDERHGDYVRASPCPMLDVPQPLLEPILIDHAAKRGAITSFNTEYVSHVQDDEGVTVTLRDLRTRAELTLRARYLLAFDGARSLVAEQLGLPFEGELARAGTVYVTFEADLSKYVEHRPSILHWIFNANAGFGEIGMGLLRAVEPWCRWIAGWGFDMTKGVPDLSDERVTRQIRDLVGDPGLEVDLIGKSTWYVNQQFATRYHSGRVLCGGDAVHRHPPSNGLGANTSLQDAFNLAWKVAYVVKGYAGAKLLESYSEERVPVGRQIVERANQSRADYAKVRTWFDHEAADPVAGGMTRLREPSPDGVKLRDELFAALEQKHYEFNAHGVELNQRYASGAVLVDPLAEQEIWTRDRELYAQATTRPGAKLPHVWLVDAHGRRVSTLDLVGRGSFTVLTGLAGRAWEEAARKLGAPFLRTVVIGEVGAIDVYGRWRRTCEMHEAGALLVRPDGYVAWREVSPEWDVTSASEKLSAALTTVLGLTDHVGRGHD